MVIDAVMTQISSTALIRQCRDNLLLSCECDLQTRMLALSMVVTMQAAMLLNCWQRKLELCWFQDLRKMQRPSGLLDWLRAYTASVQNYKPSSVLLRGGRSILSIRPYSLASSTLKYLFLLKSCCICSQSQVVNAYWSWIWTCINTYHERNIPSPSACQLPLTAHCWHSFGFSSIRETHYVCLKLIPSQSLMGDASWSVYLTVHIASPTTTTFDQPQEYSCSGFLHAKLMMPHLFAYCKHKAHHSHAAAKSHSCNIRAHKAHGIIQR